MKNLYLFNPENDMALASASPYYMTPGSIKKMAADLSALPGWYAPAGSDVLLADERQKEWMEKECRFRLPVGWRSEISPYYNKVCPWGWNPALLRKLADAGFVAESLLTGEEMCRVRNLSGRQTAVQLLPRLRIDRTIGESFLFSSFEKLLQFSSRDEELLLKSPWSGSGKGIQKVKGGLQPPVYGWAKRIVASQGSIVAEPFYNKVLDFAMEFHAGKEGVSFVGYSMFEADSRGIYKENVLASDRFIENVLASYVPLDVLVCIREKCMEELEKILAGTYVGCLGVDMMVCRDGGEYKIHPCVEINLRMNMGLVSRFLYDRYVDGERQGNYVMEYFSQRGEAFRFHELMKRDYPLEIEKDRIKSGYLSLTPVFEDTSYQIFMKVK